jgi:hypothetical protein
VAPGRQQLLISLPVEIDTIQIRPGARGSDVVLRSIELSTPFASLHVWRGDGFKGWWAVGAVERLSRDGDALRLRVTNARGGIQIDDLYGLRNRERRTKHLRLALAAGAAAGLLQTAFLILLAGRLLARVPSGGVPGPARGRVPQGAWLLLAGSTLVSLLVAWPVYRRLREAKSPSVFAATGDYSLELVDHLGRRVSGSTGNLHLVLDPYSLYRNAVNQKTSHFSIDAHGYRGGFDEKDPRPRVLFVGGSAAFGFGLDSDAEVFTARIAKLDPRFQPVNAGVIGFLSGQELSELVQRGKRVHPAAVVALDSWNDLYVPLLAASRFPAAGLAMGCNWELLSMVEDRMRLLSRGDRSEEATAFETPGQPTVSDSESVASLAQRIRGTYLSNLEEMHEDCAAVGIPFLVAIQPWTATRSAPPEAERESLRTWMAIGPRADPAFFAALRAEARTFLQAHGIPFIDLNESPEFASGTAQLFSDGLHPNAEGHRVIATEIEAKLLAKLPLRSGS